MAAYQAVLSNPGPLEVRSDSTYVVKCFNDRWYRGWKARGWRNSQKQAVANRDLWEPFIDLVVARGDVSFTWVKGHSTDRMNQLVDRLAVEASHKQQGVTLGGPGGTSAALDAAGSAASTSREVEPVVVAEPEVAARALSAARSALGVTGAEAATPTSTPPGSAGVASSNAAKVSADGLEHVPAPSVPGSGSASTAPVAEDGVVPTQGSLF